MKFKELRIGNWVEMDGGWFNQWDIKDYVDYAKCIDGAYSNDKVEPIPLTPEILEKAGFKEEDGVFTTQPHLALCFSEDEWKMNHYPFIVVNSLHQLQNLYFALTGEELKLNNE